MKMFRSWKLAFKKAVAATSSWRSDDAFGWISQVEKVATMDELSSSGDFTELDTLLAVEWDKILTGEFKKTVQIHEIRLAQEDKMIKGRQITWLVFDHFRLSDIDGALLNWSELVHVSLKGDNLKQFLNDWDTTCTYIETLPDEEGHS